MDHLSASRLWLNPWFRYGCIYLAIALTILCITIPFSHFEQFLFFAGPVGDSSVAQGNPRQNSVIADDHPVDYGLDPLYLVAHHFNIELGRHD